MELGRHLARVFRFGAVLRLDPGQTKAIAEELLVGLHRAVRQAGGEAAAQHAGRCSMAVELMGPEAVFRCFVLDALALAKALGVFYRRVQ